MLKKYFFLIVVFLLVFTRSFSVMAWNNISGDEYMPGFAQKMPNQLWPHNRVDQNLGTEVQYNSPFTNPDLYCLAMGNGYRTPSLGEFNAQYRSFPPFASSVIGLKPHWSNYKGNDFNSTLLPNAPEFRGIGGLRNEWGSSPYTDLSRDFWTAEPYSYQSEISTPSRVAVDINGAPFFPNAKDNTIKSICVKDLTINPSPVIDINN